MRPSRRTLSIGVIFLLIFCAPGLRRNAEGQGTGQLPAPWPAAAHELADKVAAAAGPPAALAMSLTNASTLGTADASAVYDGVLAELRAKRFGIVSPQPPGGPDTRVQVTLSEDQSEYVWVAEIFPAQGGERQVAIVAAPKLAAGAAGRPRISVALNRRVVWSQAGKMLDFAMPAPSNGLTTLIVLEPDRVVFYSSAGKQPWGMDGSVPVSHGATWTRGLSGAIDAASGKVAVAGVPCVGDAFHPDGLICDQARQSDPRTQPTNQEQMQIAGQALDGIGLGAVCGGIGPLLLASGDGDWAQADRLQAYDAAAQKSQSMGQALEFSGPILAIGRTAEGNAARIVSRNLQTGMYEASIITVTCGN